MDNKISNSIAKYQQTINELEELKEKVGESETEDIRFRIETKHWYGYGLEPSLSKKRSILDLSKRAMLVILNEAINKQRERINKLIDMEIEQRRTSNVR